MSEQYDVFLSHARLDGSWVHALAAELKRLGLRVFLDQWELRPGELVATGLSEGLEGSRFLVLVLPASSVQRDWVRVEWNAFFSHHGPRRLIPVKIDSVAPPAILAPFQAIDALDRDVARAAREIAAVAGRLDDLPPDDARRLFIGQELFFTLQELPDGPETSAADKPSLRVIGPAGQARDLVPPWRQDNRFGVAHFGFGQLAQAPIESDADRADLTRHATTLGCALFDLLFDPPAREHLRRASLAGGSVPVVTIRSDKISCFRCRGSCSTTAKGSWSATAAWSWSARRWTTRRGFLYWQDIPTSPFAWSSMCRPRKAAA